MFGIEDILALGSKLIDKLIPDPEAKAKANLELTKLAQEGELGKITAEFNNYKLEQDNVTNRWGDDMTSDSWLSKNIRPMSLLAIFCAYFLFAMMSAFGYNAQQSYVELLGQWGMLIMSAYFGGKTLERIIQLKTVNKK